MPLVIAAALAQRPGLEVFGTDYATPDGSAVRDYIHVSDLAEAHVLALQKLLAGGDSIFLNLGTGYGTSVLEIISVVERVSGGSVVAKLRGRRAGDPAELVASTDLARKVLGWQPQYSDLQTIVETALKWHRGPGFG